jgi:hypothetical protein
MHCIDEFQQKFHQHSTLDAPSPQHAKDLANWLRTEGIQLFKDAFRQETSRTVPRLPDDKLIEQAYPKSLNETETKQGQLTFYASNAQIFSSACTWIAESVVKASTDPRSELFASQHYHLLRDMVLDAQTLLSDWAAMTQGTPAMYGIGKNRLHDSFQISHAAEQLMFGGSPFFAFTDLATESGAALLRVALETRIRFGFGLLGVLDLSNQTVLPLNMSMILAAIKLHENKFKVSIPLQHIERIYGWSNIYVHLGLKQFTWSPIFALGYLAPLLRGGAYPGGSSVHAGLYIDKATLLEIQGEVKKTYQLDLAKYKLVTIPPEQCTVALKP